MEAPATRKNKFRRRPPPPRPPATSPAAAPHQPPLTGHPSPSPGSPPPSTADGEEASGDGFSIHRAQCIAIPQDISLLDIIFSSLAMEAMFTRFLKLIGVGFKARSEREGRELFLKLGYNHKVQFTTPPSVRVFCFKPNIICCVLGSTKIECTNSPLQHL